MAFIHTHTQENILKISTFDDEMDYIMALYIRTNKFDIDINVIYVKNIYHYYLHYYM